MTQTAQIILDKVVLVKVEANIYGARKKLKKEDLVLADGSKLPPEDLASLGSKRLLDPDQLTVFNRLKKEAERICLRVGTRFLGGFMIPWRWLWRMKVFPVSILALLHFLELMMNQYSVCWNTVNGCDQKSAPIRYWPGIPRP